ncbi:nucleoside triphosphate pyrophosphatase [Shewanella sp. NIFS-20-20]|uniref:Maf family protein n=1 Tax=Shewanella sp. NIFS-20-20 TaxID=2853806 RepID=UPI001C48F83E|nr:Maf family protein [Shewanella sp. NIFS-20-20]MBV7315313.1 Maf-like protein [Shewanella sp. NIFS-20-20]
MTLVLASSSPRRKELLAQALFAAPNTQFDIVVPDIDETPQAGELAADYVVRLAIEKAKAGLALCQSCADANVIGSDTIVVLDGHILGKPRDRQEAQATLQSLAGRRHQVMTAVAVISASGCDSRLVITEVEFCHLSAQVIDAYIATTEPMDKAGAYGIQGLGGNFVTAIDGSYSAVVGLPLVETRELLAQRGYAL